MKTLLKVLLVLCLFVSPPPTFGQTLQAVPEEPSITDFGTWELHFGLGIVVIKHTKKGVIYFAYPILDQRTVQACKPVSVVGKEIQLVESGVRFVVSYQPSLYRLDGSDWKMWDELRREFEE